MEMDKEIGAGRYGTVFKTKDKITGKKYALKHIKMEGETQGFPVTAIREIKILKALDHENIIRLEEVITYGNEQPDEKDGGELVQSQASSMDLSQFLKGSVFMVFEYVEFDMSALILSMKSMTADHVKCYMKQLLSGIFYMHTQKILHRDLKTANILITRGNVLKIADWGLARSVYTSMQRLSPKVVTLWYRSPELLLETKKYASEIDMWSVGCIFGELVVSQAILPGSVEVEQLEKIYQLCGTPVPDSETETRLKECDGWDKMQFDTVYPSRLRQRFLSSALGHDGVNLMESLLCLHPNNRISAFKALDHDYFWKGGGTPDPSQLPQLNLEDAHEAEITKKRQKKAEERQAKEREKAKLLSGNGGRGGLSKYKLKGPASSSSGNLSRQGRAKQQQRPLGAGLKAAAGGSGGSNMGGPMKRSHSERVMPSSTSTSSSASSSNLPPSASSSRHHMHKSSSAVTLSSSTHPSATSSGVPPPPPPTRPPTAPSSSSAPSIKR